MKFNTPNVPYDYSQLALYSFLKLDLVKDDED
jgi:hypothetical protein